MSSSRAKGLTTNNNFICPSLTNKQLHLFPCSDPSSLKAAPSLSHRCLEPPPPTAPPLTSMASSEPLGVMPGFGDLSFDKSLSPFPFLSISDVSALQCNVNSMKGIISNVYKLSLKHRMLAVPEISTVVESAKGKVVRKILQNSLKLTDTTARSNSRFYQKLLNKTCLCLTAVRVMFLGTWQQCGLHKGGRRNLLSPQYTFCELQTNHHQRRTWGML